MQQQIKRIFVTGGSGFLGHALCARLALEGHLVRASVRGRHSASVATDIEMVQGELEPEYDWSLSLRGVDAVVHTAARAHVISNRAENSLELFRAANVAATLNLARQAAATGVRRLIFISSVGVNGGQTNGVAFSEVDCPNPHTPYAISKYEAEQGLREIARDTGLEVIIIRPPLIHGPGAPGNFGALLRALASGWPLPLGALTRNRRSLVGLDNLVDFIITCLWCPQGVNETFLVSDGEDLSTADLLRRLCAAMAKPARLLPVPVGLLALGTKLLDKSEMFKSLSGSLQVDISKTREVLGWRPPIGVDEGLKRAVGGLRC